MLFDSQEPFDSQGPFDSQEQFDSQDPFDSLEQFDSHSRLTPSLLPGIAVTQKLRPLPTLTRVAPVGLFMGSIYQNYFTHLSFFPHIEPYVATTLATRIR